MKKEAGRDREIEEDAVWRLEEKARVGYGALGAFKQKIPDRGAYAQN